MDGVWLKPCTTSREVQSVSGEGRDRDRINSLPDELLDRILSLLVTKDAAVMSVLSRKMRRVFGWRRNLDFDDSPIHHCIQHPSHHHDVIERFPAFKSFVNGVLQTISCCHQDLTRFSLGFGGSYETRRMYDMSPHKCEKEGCFPDMNPSQLYAWITFPLTRRVRELDLRIHVRNPVKLPSAIFTCETLQVLKLDVGLEIDHELSIFSLPNLKVFELRSAFILDDAFLTRLVSSCPSLEDLTVELCVWAQGDFLRISSPSLRRLVLDLILKGGLGLSQKSSQHVFIDTPNLLYFHYGDNLAWQYSLTDMNALDMALISIAIIYDLPFTTAFRNMLSLVKVSTHVQHLSLHFSCIEALDLDRLKDQLPMFHNLKYLELGYTSFGKWDQILVEFLNCSPFLEMLTFPQGLSCIDFPLDGDEQHMLALELEPQCWRTTRAIPLCCRSHLRKIVIKEYWCSNRELDLVKFLLKTAMILEELVIYLGEYSSSKEQKTSVENTLKKLPRASITCSIMVNLHSSS